MDPVGNKIKIDIFGESHSDEIGIIAEGFPAGSSFDYGKLAAFMARRAPGTRREGIAETSSTARKEKDEVIFTDGVAVSGGDASKGSEATAESGAGEMVLTGDSFRAVIRNTDRRSGDYDELRRVLRPGHADLGAFYKYGQEGLRPGGGKFSGRMTAPLCIAGGIALQLLEQRGVEISAWIDEIGGESDEDRIAAVLEDARSKGDSLGGVIECMIEGCPAGLGGPLLDGVEGTIARMVYAIPAVKGIEFGNGFECARLRGSENNDPIILDPEYDADSEGAAADNGAAGALPIITESNNHGGIAGGITTGMPVTFRVAVKPTPSISVEQRSVDVVSMEETSVAVKGRHDVCIVPRAVPVVEAAAALAIYDLILSNEEEAE
jgi:chorismate synthase